MIDLKDDGNIDTNINLKITNKRDNSKNKVSNSDKKSIKTNSDSKSIKTYSDKKSIKTNSDKKSNQSDLISTKRSDKSKNIEDDQN